tara:strand:- start:1961 stop:3049 length:1089 start_codon:yes stop_codon:yes gene_type:complete
MAVEAAVSRYLAAGHIDEVPDDLAEPHLNVIAPEVRETRCRVVETATRLWRSAGDDPARLAALRGFVEAGEGPPDVIEGVETLLMRLLAGSRQRLSPTEIDWAIDELGLRDPQNPILTADERRQIDERGYVNLGPLIEADHLEAIRHRMDDAIAAEGDQSGREVSQMHGIGRLSGTVIKSMNRDGLLDVFFSHPRLLAVVRHILGTSFKYSSTNYHCPLPGYGHQNVHADFGWGADTPENVNAIWLIDDFTEDNGPTRVVPGSHRWAEHPSGSRVDGAPRDLNAPVPGEQRVLGKAGSCFVYNAHLWHSGTQNCSSKLRRAQHAFFTRAHRPTQMDVLAALDAVTHARFDRLQRAILDLPAP